MPQVRTRRPLNPDYLAQLDADMWLAYYNHRFLKLFLLLLKLNYSLFRPNIVTTLRGAFHSALAAVVFRKTKGHEDTARILKHLTSFYKLLSGYMHPFDYAHAAKLELAWWLIDRYPSQYKQSRAAALAETMAVIYNLPTDKLKAYGEKRASAMELLGDYHHDTHATVNWRLLRKLLRESYRALQESVDV